MGKLFGTDGIRGKAYEHPVTADMARKLGGAVVRVLGGVNTTVLIGKDTRESGQILEDALTEGLVAHGARVIRLGVVPTPAVAVLVVNLKGAAAVMLTASHNPAEDNGMKIFGGDGYKLSDALEQEIENLLLNDDDCLNPPATDKGSAENDPDGIECYVEKAKSSVEGLCLKGMKIVLDAGNGAGYSVGPRIFRELGAEVITMAVDPDGRNINAKCGALHATAAGQLVKHHGADLGVSLDGDADRVIFTDHEGNVVSGDRTLAVCALSLKRNGKLRGDAMVATVMSNLGLDEAMQREGISVSRAGVGDRMVLELMRQKDICFGGENSGHLIFRDHTTTGDGILSALQICKLMQESGKSLTALASIMDEYPSKLVNLPVKRKPALDSLPKLQALIAKAEAEFGDAGRQLIRYSGTENKIRILVEHKDATEVERWIEEFRIVIEEEIG